MSSPINCPVGNYCPVGSVNPIKCPPGTFRSTEFGESLDDCAFCGATKYCEGIEISVETGTCEAGY